MNLSAKHKSAKSCAWCACMVACSCAWCAYMLTCSNACVLGMPTCLMCLHALMFGRFVCLHVYVFSMLACFVSLCAHMFYILAVLKYLTCLHACMLLWHCLSYFLCIWKVNFQKSLYRIFFFVFREVFRTHLNIYEGVFCKKELKAKSLLLFWQKG